MTRGWQGDIVVFGEVVGPVTTEYTHGQVLIDQPHRSKSEFAVGVATRQEWIGREVGLQFGLEVVHEVAWRHPLEQLSPGVREARVSRSLPSTPFVEQLLADRHQVSVPRPTLRPRRRCLSGSGSCYGSGALVVAGWCRESTFALCLRRRVRVWTAGSFETRMSGARRRLTRAEGGGGPTRAGRTCKAARHDPLVPVVRRGVRAGRARVRGLHGAAVRSATVERRRADER